MNESLINHLFLPQYLPSSADDDFLLQNNHQNEYMLLECMKGYLNSFESIDTPNSLPIFRILTDCIQRWSILQNPQNISVSNLQSAIGQLPSGGFLPLYFHAQNAAILIEMDEKNTNQPIISSWQVLLPTAEITSSIVPHLSCFPLTTYRLDDRSQLMSKVHCELLIDFMFNTIEYSKSYKASHELNEIRDVPESHYVCQWWIQQFNRIKVESNSNVSIQFTKKHRDHIRYNTGLLPFRRSGLWMTIKVVFQTILIKRFRHIGTIVYKLLITHFLTHVIYTKKFSPDCNIATDVLVHCIRKIVRRLNKIEGLLLSIELNDVRKWIHHTKQEIEMKIDEILPKLDWYESIRKSEKKDNKLVMTNLELNHSEIHGHLCLGLKAYLNNRNSSEPSELFPYVNNYDENVNLHQVNDIPSIVDLTKKFNYTISIALIRLEIWVETYLEQWINRPLVSESMKSPFEILLRCYEEYQSKALNYYCPKKGPTDPIGYSRFILTSLTIIRFMHEKLCNDPRFERMKLHSLDIPNLMKLFEFLVLPNLEDMIRARDHYDYFRQLNSKIYPDLLTNINCVNAFGVYYAAQSSTMIKSIEDIKEQAEQDKQAKIGKVNYEKQRYTKLMNIVNSRPCECDPDDYDNQCERCEMQAEAHNINVKIYECPLPSNEVSALAVIFELQMPIEIRCYRDMLWQFINRPNPNSKDDMYEWLTVFPHANKLEPFYTGPSNRKVRLVSSTISVTQSHYSNPSIASAPVSDFLYENSLKVQITPNKPMEFEDERRILTPQLVHPDYTQLQFTLNGTQFVQNHVIAKSSNWSSKLKPMQFVEFGSFRSGHRLQWWNLLTIFELDSLSITEESVAILIIHSILQYGPLSADSDALSNHWCPESHQQIFEDHFVDELISRLNRHLDGFELNWQNELVLVVITMITMRILTICNHTKENEVIQLVMKCRRIGELWIDHISESIQKISSSNFIEVEKLRLKMITIGVACLLTFLASQDNISCLLLSNQHVISLLKAGTTVHDNISLNKNSSKMSIFMRNMIRFSERVSVMIQPTLAKFLENTSYQSVNEFVAIYWVVIETKGCTNGQWKKRNETDVYDGWYDCRYESRYISIDCIRGMFLVDGMTIGFLPEKITSNELFIRVFGYHIFEVQATELPHTYITKYPYHGDGKVHYEFHFNDQNKRLTITERHLQSDELFELIPHTCFVTELPDTFLSNHSHWRNANDHTIEFRPVNFKDPDFLNNKPYMLSADTEYGTITETATKQILIKQSSTFFESLFSRYFSRLDDKPYVYMMKDDACHSRTIIHIHLSRLGIAFKYNPTDNMITSREHSDMHVEEDQWLGTLTGLQSGLLLSPIFTNKQILKRYPYRKLIVPFGEISGAEILPPNHQIITIQRSSSMPFLQQYFVFSMNDRLKILQSSDSPTGWLYLALLHAMTSHHSPDDYTGMTGMERAFQLLNSAGCRSDQPFDALSLNILGQIAAISPRVNYYPEHLTCMERIDWNRNGIPYSLQHFGYYLIAKKLIETSQYLSFMYPSSVSDKIPEIFKRKVHNEKLLTKLYWDYQDSYNPIARLSAEMKRDVPCFAKIYEPASEHSHVTNYAMVRLVDDLYNKGNVNLIDCSQQQWLPLSEWLSGENQLKNIWVGLLKMVHCLKTSIIKNDKDQIERFEKLMDFFHYISAKCHINPFYLQMLTTFMKVSSISLRRVEFPPFINYQNIDELSFVKKHIYLSSDYSSDIRNRIISEIENCWENSCRFENEGELATSSEMVQINRLFKSWENNRKLRSFLEFIQSCISSITVEQFQTKVSYYPQKFTVESIADHHQIQVKPTEKLIEQKLLSIAHQKFHHPYSDHFDKPTVIHQAPNRQNVFPQEIFPSIDDREDSLSEITNYFNNHLNESWKKLISDEKTIKDDPSLEEINDFLECLQKESTQIWNELVKSITASNERLFEIGLLPRITPTILISYFQQKVATLDLTTEQPTLLGGILVNWTLEQQLERALHYASYEKLEDFKDEISNTPHTNWTPSEHVSWLILELEMNITIREIQINAARHMMQPNVTTNDPTVKSAVMQMNMGEGKTSIILPMLALSLSSPSSTLIRIVVLKSLFPTTYQSLKNKLGGLLNRRVFPFACRRDINFNDGQIKQIYNRLQEGLCNCDVMITSSEDILSFDLLIIDKWRQNKFHIGISMITVQRWFKKFARDVLDESDEILHVKYQLIYTVGSQRQVDAGEERWKTIQSILELVKKHAPEISRHFSEYVCYKPHKRKSAFPQFRLQTHDSFVLLCEKIATDWTEKRPCRQADKKVILSFLLDPNSSVEHLVDKKFSQNDIQLFLIVRGLLSSEVLLIALKKRYRVNYGVNPSPSFNRLMAVPFRAKDVVADRTEFGHPDVALVLTQLSYYYSGLNGNQITQCLNRLSEKETDSSTIYDQWILYGEEDNVSNSIEQWKGVNIEDYQQRTFDLFPTLRYNMLVVNYFLNHFVFPREAKQFPHKIVSSAWDLTSNARSKIITGFSGTNDTQLLLPVHIRQYDLPELQKTDAVVVSNLLQPENESYQFLPINASSNEILDQITNDKEMINVILDVGALFIDGTNRDIAIKWLNKTDKKNIDYVVYFELDVIVVCDRQFHHHRFETSPASERLDHCVFYLDEIHTRGTDFKFPKDFRAAVTLGNGLTKDRFVQACMRMRKLGNGHSLTFWSSHEVHLQIKREKKNINQRISLIDILRWVYENTVQSTWDGLHHWAAQSLSFQRKMNAFQDVHWEDHQQLFTNVMMTDLAKKCLEPEITELKQMYGVPRTLKTTDEIYIARYQQSDDYLSTEIHDDVFKRLRDYSCKKKRLWQLLDEEHQRELEQEFEVERQLAHAFYVKPCEPILHEEILRLCDTQTDMINLSQLPLVFQPLVHAFTDTTFWNECQPDGWQQNFWISTEFQRVIATKEESLNPFLRPPRWVVIYRNQHIIFISALEANSLMKHLNTQYHKQQSKNRSSTTLRLLLPRIKRNQSIFVNTSSLTVPPLIESSNSAAAFTVPLSWLVQLFIFNGTLYFESVNEQTAYCRCLALCPRPRTTTEESSFEKRWIDVDGFVSNPKHRSRLQIYQARFNSNPLTFVRQLIENRNNSHVSIMSHVGSIILNSMKLIQPSP
jgi:hypothetical protein